MANSSSILYSTFCSIRNDRYRLSIININNDEDHNDLNKTMIDVSMLGSTKISIENIKPSITQIIIELIGNDINSTPVKKTIILDHLLHVQQIKIYANRNQTHHLQVVNPMNIDDRSKSTEEQSRKTSVITADSSLRERTQSQRSLLRRQFTHSRFFSQSSSSSISDEPETTMKSIVNLTFIDASDSTRWVIQRLQLKLENEQSAETLSKNLNLCLSVLTQRPRRLLVFVNPYCGKGRGQLVYDKKILPLFQEAKIFVQTIYTRRANEAQDYVMNEDLQSFDGLICVGGDGMFAELCHGLLLRTAREANLNIDDPEVNLIRSHLRIGIIPAGSTDAVVFGTTGFNDPVTSALQIIIGESLSIDINTVHNENGFVRFMAAMVAYGFFGDIIQQSDKWRCLGPLRYDVAGFCQLVRKKSYHTQVTMKILSKDCSEQLSSSTSNDETEKNASCLTCLAKVLRFCRPNRTQMNKVGPTFETETKRNPLAATFCHRHCETCAAGTKQTNEEQNEPMSDKREGFYTTINCLNMPGRCAKSKFGMSPYVHLGDGSFDVVLVKDSWRTGFFRFLWQVAKNSSNIENLHNVEKYHVSEVCIQPIDDANSQIGNWACDGEIINGRQIRIRVHRQVLCLFASGIHSGKQEAYKPISIHRSHEHC